MTNSISRLPLHKTLVLLESLKRLHDERFHRHELLALAKALVYSISNLHFGPEVGVGAAKSDAPVVSAWLTEVEAMATDLRALTEKRNTPSFVHRGDARRVATKEQLREEVVYRRWSGCNRKRALENDEQASKEIVAQAG